MANRSLVSIVFRACAKAHGRPLRLAELRQPWQEVRRFVGHQERTG